MAQSVQKNRTGVVWPLGFVKVTTPGTPVCIMANVDANNVNAPGVATSNLSAEYSPAARGLGIQAFLPNNNNSGMQPTTGNIYLMVPAAGGNGNLTDFGSMVKIITSGSDFFFPPEGCGVDLFNPYGLFLDADVAGEGALVTLYGGVNP